MRQRARQRPVTPSPVSRAAPWEDEQLDGDQAQADVVVEVGQVVETAGHHSGRATATATLTKPFPSGSSWRWLKQTVSRRVGSVGVG